MYRETKVGIRRYKQEMKSKERIGGKMCESGYNAHNSFFQLPSLFYLTNLFYFNFF